MLQCESREIRGSLEWLLRNSLDDKLKSAPSWQDVPTTTRAVRGARSCNAPILTLPIWKSDKPVTPEADRRPDFARRGRESDGCQTSAAVGLWVKSRHLQRTSARAGPSAIVANPLPKFSVTDNSKSNACEISLVCSGSNR